MVFFFFAANTDANVRRTLQPNVQNCLACPRGVMDLVEMESTVKLFFVLPVWSFAPYPVLRCRDCGFQISVPQEQLPALSSSNDHNYNNSDLMNDTMKDKGGFTRTRCPSCGNAVQSQWHFCPNCGTERL